ncbi:nucleotide-binding protein [Amylibacter marinus]|uniref:Nucleotide-binding protein n=1 Tax=Amylibacter marinus TaxID=1475483 RepID=A0ABQ5VUM7_9RHOB|nr:RNase adapter RapZ [Amylibacter marinus]GLQ35034.1 nucleotide-binding protein [Amylibacter marinus]
MNTQPSTVVLITGPSGAGRSTAVNSFEDLGFETIENLPISLMPRLVKGPILQRGLVLSVDMRTRDFSVRGVLELLETLSAREDVEVSLFYIDCGEEVLLRRYSETRRRHPSAPDGAPSDGITREKDLLQRLKRRANVHLDTSEMSPHDLKEEVGKLFGGVLSKGLAVNVHSFSYKRGVPRGVDMVLDCRFLRNPYWSPDLRDLTGMDSLVRAYVQEDTRYLPFFNKLLEMAQMLLPAYREEGKAHFTIGLGCTGGRHRSVCVTQELATQLSDLGWQISVRHRELERRADIAKDAGVGLL